MNTFLQMLQGGLAGFLPPDERKAYYEKQIPFEAKLLNKWVEDGVIKPQRAGYWMQKHKEGMTSAQILNSLKDEDFTKSPLSPEQQKQQYESELSQKIANVMGKQYQPQADTINQRLGITEHTPLGSIGGQPFSPNVQVQPQGIMPQQTRGVYDLLSGGIPVNIAQTVQKLTPELFEVEKKRTPKEQVEDYLAQLALQGYQAKTAPEGAIEKNAFGISTPTAGDKWENYQAEKKLEAAIQGKDIPTFTEEDEETFKEKEQKRLFPTLSPKEQKNWLYGLADRVESDGNTAAAKELRGFAIKLNDDLINIDYSFDKKLVDGIAPLEDALLQAKIQADSYKAQENDFEKKQYNIALTKITEINNKIAGIKKMVDDSRKLAREKITNTYYETADKLYPGVFGQEEIKNIINPMGDPSNWANKNLKSEAARFRGTQ